MSLRNFLSSVASFFKPEAKSLANPSRALQELFGAVPTASGITISIDTALQVPAVASAVRVISEACATLDVGMREIGADGKETVVSDHPSLAFLQGEANAWTSGFDLIRDLVIDALIRDEGGLALVSRNGDGKVIEVIRYRPGTVVVTYDPATEEPSYKSASGEPINAANVIHLRPPFGRCPMTLAREAIGAAALMEQHAAGLFARGARPSSVLLFPKGAGEEMVKKVRAAWSASQEGFGNSGKTAVLYDGVEFKPIAFSSTDAQFLENRNFQITEIARAFRVPPSMLFQLDRATWSNTEQMGREFLIYCLEPWLRSLEAVLTRALILPEDRARLRIRFDRDDLTRADLSTRATTINSLIASKTINPNEGRAWLNLEPRDGGDAFENPNIATTPKLGATADKPEDANGPV